MERKDVETKYTWDLSPIFPSDEAWEKEYKDFEKAFENSGLSSYQGKLGDKEKLLGFFKLRDTLSRRLEKFVSLCQHETRRGHQGFQIHLLYGDDEHARFQTDGGNGVRGARNSPRSTTKNSKRISPTPTLPLTTIRSKR